MLTSQYALFFKIEITMRKIFASVLFAVISIVATAAPVNRQHALSSARAILQGKKLSEVALPVSVRKRIKVANRSEAPAFYVFNADDGKGFAIIAGDDTFPEIVGYSEKGSFRENVEMPPALADFMAFYSQYVADVRAGKAAPPTRRRAQTATYPATVAPLLTCEFGQDAPYNNLCYDSNNRLCPCGCVATAVAQIMYYWQWPDQSSAATGYNWSAVYPTTEENLASEDASAVIAQVCSDLGRSLDMQYTPTGSGAQSNRVVNILSRIYGYVPTSLRYYWRMCSSSSEEWMNIIKREVSSKRPVYYSAASLIGSGRDAGGHAFVIDGYNSTDFVHVNWGWDGRYNAYYDIALLDPPGYSFIEDQTIITGIQPNRYGITGTVTDYMQLRDVPVYTGSKTFRNNVEFKIIVNNIYNINANAHNWEYSIGLFDTSLRLIETIQSLRVIPSVSLGVFYYMPESEVACKLSNYSDGEYVLRVVFREKGSADWLLPDVVGGQDQNLIPIRIASKKVTMYAEDVEIITPVEEAPTVAPDASAARVMVYDLQGHLLHVSTPEAFRLDNVPARGLLIIKQGDKVRKVVR